MEPGLTGDLEGHVYFGLVFVAWAVARGISLMREGGPVVRRPLDPDPDPALGALPAALTSFEAWAKVVLPLFGIAGELRWIAFPMTDASVIIYQHITAYGIFSVAGVVDLLAARKRVPSGADHVALAGAFAVAGFLFLVHGHHLSVSVALHTLLAWLLLAQAGLIVWERFRPAPLLRWSRLYVLLLTGTWLLQLAWMLYVAGYDLDSPMVVLRTHLFFMWHAAGAALVILGTTAMARRRAE